MAHFDRGVYEPSDEVRVFDGSEDDEDVEGSRLPLLIVLALLVLAMFGGVVWLAYTQGVARGRTETPVLTAQNGPARVAPENPGGVEQAYKGFKVYEQPAPPDEAPTVTAPAPSPMASAAPVAPPVAPPAAQPKPEPAPLAAAPKPVAKPEPVKVAPAPAKPAAVAAKPAAPVTIPAAATAAPRSLTAAAPPPRPAPVATAPAPSAPASGNFVLQIGAYKSQADAEGAWKTYKARHAALLAGATYQVQQADLGEKGTWYRLRITGYPSKDVASAMCDRLKTDGGACLPGK